MLMCDATDLWKRRPCGFTDLSLSIHRYHARCPVMDVYLSGRITEVGLDHRRIAYRRIWQSYCAVKGLMLIISVYRFYHWTRLGAKRRLRCKRLATELLLLLRAAAPIRSGRWISSWTCWPQFEESSALPARMTSLRNSWLLMLPLKFQACKSREFWTESRGKATLRRR